MSNIIPLEKKELPSTCLVFKHSTQCPISAAAAAEVKEASFSLPLYWINVIEQRDISNWVEAQFGVQHESPQLLCLKDGKAVSSWSHRKITKEVLKEF